MKTAGILTSHCADNYGAVLQTYALKTYLESEGILAEIINYIPTYRANKTRIWPDKKTIVRYFERGGWKSVLLDLYAERIRNFTKRLNKKKKFQQFRKKHIKIQGHRIKNPKKLDGTAYDYYIAGSDQIWNPQLTNGIDGAYYLDFVPQDKIKISYAASLGANAHESYADEMGEKIRHLDKISIREQNSKKFVEQISGRTVEVVIDPVFLLNKQDWLQLIDDTPRVDGKFIFFYFFDKNDTAIELANALSEKYNLPIVHFYYGGLRNKIKNEKKCFTFDGPLDFLWYIKHAEYVITSSFHGVAFSVLFEKKFYPFIFKERGNRVTDLLADLETSMTVYNYQTKSKDIPEPEIDYKKINIKLEQIRNHSKNYLLTSLE